MDPFTRIPGFDEPIAVLKHCHDRIRKQIRTMQKLLVHLPEYGADPDARQGADAVLRYFNNAARLHHADEEENLLPMLQASATNDDAAALATLIPRILEEHVQMDKSWRILHPQLQQIATGQSAVLSAEEVQHFAEMYAAHMEKEETMIAPMAKRIFSHAQMTQLGNAMRTRRDL
ncbi:MAG TPA: hemerythrin domain-containing protein [Paucimonas sp.]|nr:hemerythrin domain-containing protein [Paucimonas sp.]HJW57927.1 hemerythrin domain-containing protein [Burkholderiaceae bacterium]